MIFKQKRLAYFQEYEKDFKPLPDTYVFRSDADPNEVHDAVSRLYGQEIRIPAAFMSSKLITFRLIDPDSLSEEDKQFISTYYKIHRNSLDLLCLDNMTRKYPDHGNVLTCSAIPSQSHNECLIDIPNKTIIWRNINPNKRSMGSLFSPKRLAYFQDYDTSQPDTYTFTAASDPKEIRNAMSRLYGQTVEFESVNGNYNLYILDPKEYSKYTMLGSLFQKASDEAKRYDNDPTNLRFPVVDQKIYNGRKDCTQNLNVVINHDRILTIDVPNKKVSVMPIITSSFRCDRIAYFEEIDNDENLQKAIADNNKITFIGDGVTNYYPEIIKILKPHIGEDGWRWFPISNPASSFVGTLRLEEKTVIGIWKYTTRGTRKGLSFIDLASGTLGSGAMFCIDVANKEISYTSSYGTVKKAYFEEAISGIDLGRHDFIEINYDPENQQEPKPSIRNGHYLTSNWAQPAGEWFVIDKSQTSFNINKDKRYFWSPSLDIMYTEYDYLYKEIPGYDTEKLLEWLYNNFQNENNGAEIKYKTIFEDPMTKRAYFEEIDKDENIQKIIKQQQSEKEWVSLKNSIDDACWSQDTVKEYNLPNGFFHINFERSSTSAWYEVRDAKVIRIDRYKRNINPSPTWNVLYNKELDILACFNGLNDAECVKIAEFIAEHHSKDLNVSILSVLNGTASMQKKAYFEEIDNDENIQKEIADSKVYEIDCKDKTHSQVFDEALAVLKPHFGEQWSWQNKSAGFTFPVHNGELGIHKGMLSLIHDSNGYTLLLSANSRLLGGLLEINIPTRSIVWYIDGK